MSAVVPQAGGVTGIDVAPPAGLLRTLSRHRGFRVGAVLAIMLAALALIGPLLAHGPNVTDYANQLAPPGARHWLGTDGAGRDNSPGRSRVPAPRSGRPCWCSR